MGQADGAKRSKRIGFERGRSTESKAPAPEIREAPAGVDDRRVSMLNERPQRRRHRVDRKISRVEVGLQRGTTNIRDIDGDRLRPNAEERSACPPLLIKREKRSTKSIGRSTGDGQGIGWDHEVEISDPTPADHRVSHRAAD